jgi:hypothetical protein
MAFVFDTEIRVSIDWTQNGVPKDATTTLIIEPPGSTSTLYSSTAITHPSTGNYYFDLDGDIAGVWEYRWIAANPKGAGEGYFNVEPSRIDDLNPI